MFNFVLRIQYAQQIMQIYKNVVYNLLAEMNKMNLILHTLKQEKQRIEFMLARYEAEFSNLSKGNIYSRTNGDKTYYYLKYRSGNKVISKYINRDEIEEVRNSIEKRKHIKIVIDSLKKEKSIADKLLEDYS